MRPSGSVSDRRSPWGSGPSMPASEACSARKENSSMGSVTRTFSRTPSGAGRRDPWIGWRYERRTPRASLALGSARPIRRSRRSRRRWGRSPRNRASTTGSKELVQMHVVAAQRLRVLRPGARRPRRRGGRHGRRHRAAAGVAGVRRVLRPRARGARARRGVTRSSPRTGIPDDVYDRVGGILTEAGVRRAELDPRVDQRVQPDRDRRALPRSAPR